MGFQVLKVPRYETLGFKLEKHMYDSLAFLSQSRSTLKVLTQSGFIISFQA